MEKSDHGGKSTEPRDHHVHCVQLKIMHRKNLRVKEKLSKFQILLKKLCNAGYEGRKRAYSFCGEVARINNCISTTAYQQLHASTASH